MPPPDPLVEIAALVQPYMQHLSWCQMLQASCLMAGDGPNRCSCGLDAARTRLIAPRLPEGQEGLCVCGHGPDAHGNDGEGHCGEKQCRRRGGCNKFRLQVGGLTQDEQDAAELAAAPESYATVVEVDHFREMARRFAESRDELKHRVRALEGELAAIKAGGLIAPPEGPEPPPSVYGSEVLCEACAKVFCPHGERGHFFHDGCPQCDAPEALVPPSAQEPSK